jgi:hypothetical protein
MALTGELNDLSLAELIEFFCNQRKTGRLKVTYPLGAGHFYLKNGAVVHARFGDLRGIDAVFFALTQPNASFKFSPAFESPEQTINQPWTSVVLEGLRRMDEGVKPRTPSVLKSDDEHESDRDETAVSTSPTVSMSSPAQANVATNPQEDVEAFGVLLSGSASESFSRRRWNPVFVVAAVMVVIAAVGVPWGWYTHKRSVRMSSEANAATPQTEADTATPSIHPSDTPAPSPESPTTVENEAELAKRQREARARERAKALEQASSNETAKSVNPAASAASNKRAVVTVTYDENGRVTAASGGDATALRIARQKRFPPGKPGSATVTIPIN